MTTDEQQPKLVVAISSRALFDLDESHRLYEAQGVEAFRQYQIERESEPLEAGVALPMVRKLLRINQLLNARRVEVLLLSRNTADTGLRVMNSIVHHDLGIECAAFCGGQSPYRYARAMGADLFLSNNGDDVRVALDNGMAAASLHNSGRDQGDEHLRIAFDGDAVLFSDEAESLYQAQGLRSFQDSEQARADHPLQGGPFKPFLAALHQLQKEFGTGADCPIRTALFTSRAAPAHERVVKTLRSWNIRLDESLFLGGKAKGPFLEAFRADIFFDDQTGHCDSAASHEVASAHVPYGVINAADAVGPEEDAPKDDRHGRDGDAKVQPQKSSASGG